MKKTTMNTLRLCGECNLQRFLKSLTRNREAILSSIFLVVILITGCVQRAPPPENIAEVRPGVYLTNEAGTLELPTSGYDIYVIGEDHGMYESHLLMLEYLKKLHETGLRDIVLEAPQAYERMANEYIQGINEHILEINDEMACFATVVLGDLRSFNESLPDDEKIRVHLVDVDSPLSAIHLHLQELREELAEPIRIPPLNEFETLTCNEMLDLVDQLAENVKDPSLQNELETIRSSINFYFEGSQIGLGVADAMLTLEGCRIREERICQNIMWLRKKLEGAPLLVKYGGWHTQKRQAMSSYSDVEPWVQQLKAEVSIYSVYVIGVSGLVWHSVFGTTPYRKDPYQIQLFDTTLGDILESEPDCTIAYIDLRWYTNVTVRLGNDFKDVQARQIYDGLIVYRKVHPLVKKCPKKAFCNQL